MLHSTDDFILAVTASFSSTYDRHHILLHRCCEAMPFPSTQNISMLRKRSVLTFHASIDKTLEAVEKVGLRIQPDKTKILSNQSTINSDTKRYVKVGDMSIEILTRNESVKYLGQRISFYQQETTEIKSRIRAAWATFHTKRQELTSKNYMLKHRDATVSPTICYAAGTWVSNKEHERMIQSTQRKMLRRIIQTTRIYKKIEKQDIEPRDENRKVDITDMCSADDE